MPSRLKRFLDTKGVSAYWLQQQTGLAYNTIYRLLRYDNVGTIDTWRRIAQALGVQIDEIIGDTKKEEGEEDGGKDE